MLNVSFDVFEHKCFLPVPKSSDGMILRCGIRLIKLLNSSFLSIYDNKILRCGVGPTTLDPSLPPGVIAKDIESEMMTPKN